MSKKKMSIGRPEPDALTYIARLSNGLLTRDFSTFSAGWSNFDLSLWAILAANVRDKGARKVILPSKEVKKLMNLRSHISIRQFVKQAKASMTKFSQITVTIEKFGKRDQFDIIPMFSRLHIDNDDKDMNMYVQVYPDALPAFNDLTEWTRYSIPQYTRILNNCSKRLFLFLKQWRSVGGHSFTPAELRKDLDISKSYRATNIWQKVVLPGVLDLAPYFHDLTASKTYKGRKITHYKFSFAPQSGAQLDRLPRAAEETECYYNILTNPHLSQSDKFKAIDRYMRFRSGTTKHAYDSQHPNTVFVSSEISNDGPCKRAVLNDALSYRISNLRLIVVCYEKLLTHGKLMDDDLHDLAILEERLIAKEAAAEKKKPGFLDKYKATTIAEDLISNIHMTSPGFADSGITQDDIRQEIIRSINAMFGHAISTKDIKKK